MGGKHDPKYFKNIFCVQKMVILPQKLQEIDFFVRYNQVAIKIKFSKYLKLGPYGDQVNFKQNNPGYHAGWCV